jgi:hypothetical protein
MQRNPLARRRARGLIVRRDGPELLARLFTRDGRQFAAKVMADAPNARARLMRVVFLARA